MVKPLRSRAIVMSLVIMPLFIGPVTVDRAWSLMRQRPSAPPNYLLGKLVGHDVITS